MAQTPASREGAHDRHLTGPEADRRLPKLSQEELKALWREYFGVEPPAYRRGFLFRGLAHRIQELTYGGLKPAYQARLDAMIECTESARGGHLSRASARGVRVSDSRMCARKRWLGDSRPLDTRRSLAGAPLQVLTSSTPSIALRLVALTKRVYAHPIGPERARGNNESVW